MTLRLSLAALLTATTAALAGECPYPEFDAFLAAFDGDAAVQADHIRFPLEIAFLDMTAEPEPAKVTEQRAQSDLPLPLTLFPGPDVARRMVFDPAPDQRVVHVQGLDSGLSVSYYFAARPCWTLMRIDSDST
ncbi:MAG: hypothetical protein Q4G25_13600 [Paracoccus sp. (in: a-proteobacteria)]|nr:hypothetical protein [Paracoccus sp. (in: a-proteobacteria)]